MSSLGISVCLLLLSVFISSVSQIILKKAADKTYESTLKEYMNPMVIGAYGRFFLFCNTDHAGFEACASFHVTDPGIYRLHLCISNGIYFSERKIQQAETYGLCPDTCRDRHIQLIETRDKRDAGIDCYTVL